MGLADAMGPQSDKVKDVLQISNVQSTLLSFAVFIAFAVFSVPGGLLAARIGKKNLLLLGLGINAVSSGDPVGDGAAISAVLLGCIFLLGVGTTFLQVSGQSDHARRQRRGQLQPQSQLCPGHQGHRQHAATRLLTAIAAIAFFHEMGWRPASRSSVL